jgi:hypothetical protein
VYRSQAASSIYDPPGGFSEWGAVESRSGRSAWRWSGAERCTRPAWSSSRHAVEVMRARRGGGRQVGQ